MDISSASFKEGILMLGIADETVGTQFQADFLQMARDKSLQVILQAAKLIRPGMTEDEARNLVQDIQAQLGAPKSWHPSQIRFGENTLLPFGQKGKDNPVLEENDIFFFDIGPIFAGHE